MHGDLTWFRRVNELPMASPRIFFLPAVFRQRLEDVSDLHSNARSRRGGASLWDRQRKQEHGRQWVEATTPIWVGLGDGSAQLRTITRSARVFSLRSW
jgi:hypothetical protein